MRVATRIPLSYACAIRVLWCGVGANPRARRCLQNLRDGRDTPNTRAAAQWLAQMGAPVEGADAGA